MTPCIQQYLVFDFHGVLRGTYTTLKEARARKRDLRDRHLDSTIWRFCRGEAVE